MNTQNTNYHFGGGAGNTILPVSAFSAYSLLRNCNYLLSAQSSDIHLKSLPVPRITSDYSLRSPSSEDITCFDTEKSYLNFPSKPFPPNSLLGYPHHLRTIQNDKINSRNVQSPCSQLYNSSNLRRQRSEKKPIPDEQKDEKYFERRRRNNQAAKKSRDARKMREDQIALRATILEHENALLRAQVLTLREEASSLRQMLLQKKAIELSSRD